MADVPMLVISDSTSSERRITPSWTITLLRGKLEHITGVPPSSQRLSIKTPAGTTPIEAADEDATTLDGFPLAPYAELHVSLSPCSFSLPEPPRGVLSQPSFPRSQNVSSAGGLTRSPMRENRRPA
jgi:hypothetical protein